MKNYFTKKSLFVVTMLWICFCTMPNFAACSEKYYINNKWVLLYKVINWWYDSLPEESHLLCGDHIECRSEGNIQIVYDAIEMKIRLSTKENFADLLSVFKQCEQCWGPSYLTSTWLNEKYFGGGKYVTSRDKCTTLNSYLFGKIERINAIRIKNIENDIGLELEGSILGLMDGKIALHQSGTLLKTCQMDKNKGGYPPISLKIVNYKSGEILANFSMAFDGKKHNQANASDAKKHSAD